MANWDQGTQWDSTCTNLTIIKRAMRKIQALPSGQEPTTVQAMDALQNLQGLVMELIGMGTLGRVYDVIADEDVTAHEWTRIRCAAGVEVTLPETITQATADSWPWDFSSYGGLGPDYGWYYFGGWDCYPRTPFDMAPVIVVDSDGNETASIYQAYLGTWVAINNMGLQDSFPFAITLREGFACMLAERMADEYGQPVGAVTARQAAWCRTALASKFSSAVRSSGSPANYF